MTLHPQETDPGAVGAGHVWADTSTDPARLWMRNGDNTAWTGLGIALGVEFAVGEGGSAGALYYRFAGFGAGFTIQDPGTATERIQCDQRLVVLTPETDQEAATKAYVDTAIAAALGKS